MIDYQVLNRLILEALKGDLRMQFPSIGHKVQALAVQQNLFPSAEECRERSIDYNYYAWGRLNPLDIQSMNQILWDLVIDRVLTLEGDDAGRGVWPFFRLTEFGRSVADEATLTPYDPDGYISAIESVVNNLDPVIRQYVLEGLHCFRQRLYFAAAVMFGAAAEMAILLLLQSIGDAETNLQRKSEIQDLLDRGRLPTIFGAVRNRLDAFVAAQTIPYRVHEGSTEHLLSLFEAIGVQRNDAVHPAAGRAERMKVFLTIQTFPAALEVVYRLIAWFRGNQI